MSKTERAIFFNKPSDKTHNNIALSLAERAIKLCVIEKWPPFLRICAIWQAHGVLAIVVASAWLHSRLELFTLVLLITVARISRFGTCKTCSHTRTFFKHAHALSSGRIYDSNCKFFLKSYDTNLILSLLLAVDLSVACPCRFRLP